MQFTTPTPLRRRSALLAGAALMLLAAAPSVPAETAALPADSIYHLHVTLTDQDGRSFPLDARRGHPMVVSMFYTNCDYACPTTFETLRMTEARLGEAERARLGVLMVSLDPVRDTVPALRQTMEQRGVDSAHWTLARTEPADVRRLAAVLGIQYRALPSGDFNHSSVLLLVDADGRIVARTAQLGHVDPAFLARVKSVLARA